jgi:Fe-S oxidoreductase
MSSFTVDRGIKTLTAMIDAPMASFFSGCVRCGLCAETCLFYLETGNPEFTPIRKVEPMRRLWKMEYTLLGRLGKMLGFLKPITDEEFAKWELLVYDSCTLCGRCSLVCPVGKDITYMIGKVRQGLFASGHAPKELKDASVRALKHGSPGGNLLPALKAQVKHQEEDTGIPVELDKEGAEYMVILSAQETIEYPEVIGAMAKIFKHAGKTWTISTEAYEATNVGLQIGSVDIAKVLIQRLVDAAEKLGVKYVISPECGHAYQALRWEGPNYIGRPYKFEVIHIVELLNKLRKEGKLKPEGKHAPRVTFHDPCQTVRRGGIESDQRDILEAISDNFVEMDDPGRWNWCCSGGGGVGANERAKENKLKAFEIKRRQIDKVKPDQVVTMCAFCRHTLDMTFEELNIELPVLGLTELLAEYIPSDGDSAAGKGEGD